MAQNVPAELQTSMNRHVLDHVKGLSAHSDIVEATYPPTDLFLPTLSA